MFQKGDFISYLTQFVRDFMSLLFIKLIKIHIKKDLEPLMQFFCEMQRNVT